MNTYRGLQGYVSFKEQERAELQRAADTDAFSPVLWWTAEGGGHPQGLRTRMKYYREELKQPPLQQLLPWLQYVTQHPLLTQTLCL